MAKNAQSLASYSPSSLPSLPGADPDQRQLVLIVASQRCRNLHEASIAGSQLARS
ncbi:MAG: hypothetical protein NT107_06265 [Planctomycetota bacterium]|nr:hypothetical protein [Planctomycetota bacterium]